MHHPWAAPPGPRYELIGDLSYQMLHLHICHHPDATAADLLELAVRFAGASALDRRTDDLQLWVEELTADANWMGSPGVSLLYQRAIQVLLMAERSLPQCYDS